MISVNIFPHFYRRLCLMNLLWTATMLPRETCGVISLLIAIRVIAEDSFVFHAHQHCHHCGKSCESAEKKRKGRKNIYQLQLKSFSSPEVGKAFQWRIYLIRLSHSTIREVWRMFRSRVWMVQLFNSFHVLFLVWTSFYSSEMLNFFFTQVSSWIRSTWHLRF